jgi:penicillin amidase
MTPSALKRLRLFAAVVFALLVLAASAGGWFYSRLRASLPQLDGALPQPGLAAAVTIERDALGVPTIRGASRADVARGLGFAHAQDRFFQMDLLRRIAAGELAEIIGPAALPRDRASRRHGFRALAGAQLARTPAAERAVIAAYTAGVNAGLAALGAKPFEYFALRIAPAPWREEDSLLVGYAMLLTQQGDAATRERELLTLRETLGAEALAFFAPAAGPRDAALDGSRAALPPIPSAKALTLRPPAAPLSLVAPARFDLEDSAARALPGSNALALAGAHTASGAGMVANDMHLDLAVPNTWYRASLVWPEAGQERRVTGVTLPGGPVFIAGSNGSVAWGFTNSEIDTSDLVIVPIGISPELYRAFGHATALTIETRHELIAVKGREPVAVDYRWTIWGPIVGTDADHHPLAQRWVGHEPGAISFNLLAFENVRTAAEAVAAAHRAGVPSLNLIVADAAGAIAWTVAGPVPKRVGYDGRLPVAWTFGDRRWDGLLSPDDVPAILMAATDASGRLWSGNQRQLGGAGGALLGDGGFAEPMRAAQLRDDLAPLERATPRDLLAVELDDRALALERWQKFLLGVLTPEVTAAKARRAPLRALVEKWEGRASVDSVSYRLVRTFRQAVAHRVLDPIFAPCVEADAAFDWANLRYEEPLWALLQAKPAHLLNPEFASWDAVFAAAVDDTLAALAKQDTSLNRATWGQANRAHIVHPLSRALPGWLTFWLNLPDDPLPGDTDLPRVQRRAFGASERFVVSPGREAEGIFHMPGGQSGHPLSPYFRAGHAAWVHGEPTPFLPGKTEHTLTLQP